VRRLVLAAVLTALIVVPAAQAWTWPASGAVLEPFLFDPAHPFAAGQHRGIVVGADPGAAVLAPAAGVVTFAGTVPSSGKSVTITTPDGLAVTLTHLGALTVSKNATVAEGAAVGEQEAGLAGLVALGQRRHEADAGGDGRRGHPHGRIAEGVGGDHDPAGGGVGQDDAVLAVG